MVEISRMHLQVYIYLGFSENELVQSCITFIVLNLKLTHICLIEYKLTSVKLINE